MTTAIERDAVESALECAGLPFKTREQGWIVPAGGQRPSEVSIIPNREGLRLECVLAEWDEIGAAPWQALSHFLSQAQTGLRIICCELREHQAAMIAQLDAGEIEARLPAALGAVLAASRMLTREAAALLIAEVADGYLRFHGAPCEMPEDNKRM
jgi:hypothetical protein